MPIHLKTLETLKKISLLPGEERINFFQALRAQTGEPDFQDTINNGIIQNSDADSSTVVKSSYLAYAILQGNSDGLLEFVQMLIEAGAAIDDDTYLVISNREHSNGLTLMHVCAKKGEFGVFEYLATKHKLSSLTVTHDGESLLDFLPHELPTWKNFLTFLNEQGVLDQLCRQNKDNRYNIFNQLLESSPTADIPYTLYTFAREAYQCCFIEKNTLEKLAKLSLIEPSFYSMFHDASTRQKLTFKKRAKEADLHQEQQTDFENMSVIIDNKEAFDPSEDPAMITAIDDYVNHVLRHPGHLRILLRILNEQLQQALEEAGIHHRFDNASLNYQLQHINTYQYPVPNEHYQTLKKQSILERVLMTLLKSAGMGNASRKWFGFIPHEHANKMITDGDFFIESQFGIGVLHGKFSHMIQWALLILAIEQGYIRTQPGITAKSIIAYLVNHQETTSKMNLFAFMIDSQATSEFSFQDPYRLCSLMTTGYFGQDCRTLEIYLRDAFCSGYLQWLGAFNEALPTPITGEAFSELLSHTDINVFLPSTYSVVACEKRIRETIGSASTHKTGFFSPPHQSLTHCMIVEKDYFSNKKYK